MVKFVACKFCGKALVKGTKVCPNCGARQKNGNTPLYVFITIVGIALFLAGLRGFTSTDKAKESNPPATATAAIEETTSPDATELDEANESEPKEINSPTISMDEFNAISTGMTYEEVVAIIGSEGEVLSEVDVSGYKTVVYMWKGNGILGSNANVTIQGGKVIGKAQIGLK